MLLLLMPPFGIMQLAQPVMEGFSLPYTILVAPVAILVAVPAVQIWFEGKKPSATSGGGLNEGLSASSVPVDGANLTPL